MEGGAEVEGLDGGVSVLLEPVEVGVCVAAGGGEGEVGGEGGCESCGEAVGVCLEGGLVLHGVLSVVGGEGLEPEGGFCVLEEGLGEVGGGLEEGLGVASKLLGTDLEEGVFEVLGGNLNEGV